jgi:cell division protein FtsQ
VSTSTQVRSHPNAPRPPVDPRIRARWIAARREEGRRRLRVMVVVVSVVAVLALAWGITVSPLLAVDKFIVRGTNRTTVAEVQRASGVHEGDSMVWLDPSAVTTRVEASPWIRSAKVTRDWPRTLIVSVIERTPVAWVKDGTGALVVDGTGRVVTRDAAPPAGFPEIVGVQDHARPGTSIVPAAGARIAAAFGPYVAAVDHVTTQADNATLVLKSGIEVRLGPPSQIRAKLAAANAVITALGTSPPHYVDVSVPTNPVAG